VVASIWGDLVGLAVVVLALGVAGAAVASLLIGRSLRRRWRLLRSHGAVIGLLAVWDAIAAVRARRRGAPAIGEVAWSSPRQVRRTLRRSVDSATDAVRTAGALGAPVAELPNLCSRLEAAAADLDRVIRLEPAGPVPPSVRGQVREVMRAADDVRRVAMVSAGDACDPRIAQLSRDAEDEVHLLGAGLASARAALAQPRR
jgi:hypothetical protein